MDSKDLLSGYLGACRSVDAFEKLNRLGKGTYGTVYRAKEVATGEIVAVKKVRIHAGKEVVPRSSLREIRLLKKFEHDNIVKLLEVVCGRQAGHVFLVFEYCEHDVGALLDLMERPFSAAEVKCLVLQLLRAVATLHAQSIIHRDIKLSNLLLTNRGVLKLADFGLAREFEAPTGPCTTNVVTLWYRSPELLLGAKDYSVAIDIWSTGCSFGELLNKKPLLPGRSEENQFVLICELLGTPSTKIWPGLEALPIFGRLKLPAGTYNNLGVKFPEAPDSCLDLLNRMLTFDPAKRATATDCLQHRYFSETPPPQELQWMPTFREHRNMRENPRNAVHKHDPSSSSSQQGLKRGSSHQSLPPRSALFAANKRVRSTIF